MWNFSPSHWTEAGKPKQSWRHELLYISHQSHFCGSKSALLYFFLFYDGCSVSFLWLPVLQTWMVTQEQVHEPCSSCGYLTVLPSIMPMPQNISVRCRAGSLCYWGTESFQETSQHWRMWEVQKNVTHCYDVEGRRVANWIHCLCN